MHIIYIRGRERPPVEPGDTLVYLGEEHPVVSVQQDNDADEPMWKVRLRVA